MLASLLYPYDNDAPKLIDKWIVELVNEGCLHRYTISGDTYIEICKWLIHQKIDRPTKSKIPPFASTREDSRGFDEDSSGDLRIKGPKDQRIEGSEDQGPKDQGSREKLAQPDGVTNSVWSDFLSMRRKMKAAVTSTAVVGIEREAHKAGMSLDAALRMCCERGWRGFRADWVKKAELNGQERVEVDNREIAMRFIGKRQTIEVQS